MDIQFNQNTDWPVVHWSWQQYKQKLGPDWVYWILFIYSLKRVRHRSDKDVPEIVKVTYEWFSPQGFCVEAVMKL